MFSFGIGIGREHWRNGYATQALQPLFRFYFGELGYQKVETGVYAFNQPLAGLSPALRLRRGGSEKEGSVHPGPAP